VAIREKISGGRHAATAFAVETLATVRATQGDVVAARELLDRALGIRARANGPAHPKTADCLEMIAVLPAPPGESSERAQARQREAAGLLERVTAIRSATLGKDHPETVAAQRRLAVAWREAGDAARADEIDSRLPAAESPRTPAAE
jgi:hypothetical protein